MVLALWLTCWPEFAVRGNSALEHYASDSRHYLSRAAKSPVWLIQLQPVSSGLGVERVSCSRLTAGNLLSLKKY